MKKLVSKEFTIGLSVLAGLVILYFGINYLKGINLFKKGNFYYVNYENVAGLETAAPITIDGYKVGEVREIKFDYKNPGIIRVTLSINKDLKVPDDSRAVIVSGLMSGPSIQLQLGKSKDYLPEEGIIKGELEKGLMNAVNEDVMPTVAELLPHIDSLILSLNTTAANLAALSGKEELSHSVDNIDRITSDLAALSQTLNSTMSKKVPGLMNDAGAVADNLKIVTGNVAQITEELKKLPLQTSLQNVEETTANLERLSRDLCSTNGTIGKLINDPTLYHQLNRVTADIDSLINDVKANPKRYINIKLL